MAVGDGANDVNMIQKAHVGIGLYGKEGSQAASFSDYALPNFKSLRRLLFWHGRGFGVRLSNFIRHYLWKSAIYAINHLYFNLQNGFSGQTLYSDLFYALYDVNITSFGILYYTVFD